VEVVERRHRSGVPYDLAYRPYQAIDPSEFEWLASAGRRLLIGQLDMIGFSNPSYHPSVELFHTVRNLQRHMMRAADGVTFISDFGRETARVECPEIPERRTHVVGCGVDVVPGSVDSVVPPTSAQSFVVCLSATFHHKNRAHAIRTFASLCERHGYAGSLVIAGPEPYYGRSDDSSLIKALAGDVARRIERLGHIDVATKWWLLRRADLVLYPSVVEGFGLVPFEASAVGTPSLSYDGTGLKEVLDVEDVLVATWDADAWADRAMLLICDEEQRSRAVERVIAAGARHRWADVASRTWEVIDATIAAPSVNSVDEGSAWARIGYSRRSTRRLMSTRHLAVRVFAALERRLALVVEKVRSRR
jgi:glycosyltransferase involved in cell wall biosynthesis